MGGGGGGGCMCIGGGGGGPPLVLYIPMACIGGGGGGIPFPIGYGFGGAPPIPGGESNSLQFPGSFYKCLQRRPSEGIEVALEQGLPLGCKRM